MLASDFSIEEPMFPVISKIADEKLNECKIMKDVDKKLFKMILSLKDVST